ncbi:MAG: Jag N-terminal domain-containing protein [Elusimicrobia bacterium]|nr:Jag N-terminal domain-containing protein [Elusimicrobiota bacterium]
MKKDKFEFSGKNVEEAIKKGLKKLKLEKSEAEISIIDEGKAGLFGMMGKTPARVHITKKGTNLEIDWDKVEERIKRIAGTILSNITEDARIEISRDNRKALVNIDSRNNSVIIGKKGQTLDAIEHIVNLSLKKDPETRVDIIMDTGKYRKNRVKTALDNIDELVNRVKSDGKEIELEPMDYEERKLVHERIKSISGIETKSKGHGKDRRVVIRKSEKNR